MQWHEAEVAYQKKKVRSQFSYFLYITARKHMKRKDSPSSESSKTKSPSNSKDIVGTPVRGSSEPVQKRLKSISPGDDPKSQEIETPTKKDDADGLPNETEKSTKTKEETCKSDKPTEDKEVSFTALMFELEHKSGSDTHSFP